MPTAVGNFITVTATEDLAQAFKGSTSEFSPTMQVSSLVRPKVNDVQIHWYDYSQPNPHIVATYDVPVGSGQQIRTIELANPNQFSITFTEPINVASLTGALSAPRHDAAGSLTIGSPTWDAGTNTATWSFTGGSPVIGQYILTLANNVSDLAANTLDGYWDNPTSLADSSDTFPSGGGALVHFEFYLTFMPGDVNRDNVIDIVDLNTVQNNFGTAGTWANGNMDGDSTVDIDDLNFVRNSFGADFDPWDPPPSLLGGGPSIGEEALMWALWDYYHNSESDEYDDLLFWDELGNDEWWKAVLSA